MNREAEIVNTELNILKNTAGWKIIVDYVGRLRKVHADNVMNNISADNNTLKYTENDLFKLEYKMLGKFQEIIETIKSELGSSSTVIPANFAPEFTPKEEQLVWIKNLI